MANTVCTDDIDDVRRRALKTEAGPSAHSCGVFECLLGASCKLTMGEEHGASWLVKSVVVGVCTVAEGKARVGEVSSSDAFYDGLGGWGPPRIRFCEAEDVNAFDISVVENGWKALPRVLMNGVCILEGESNDGRRRGGLGSVSPERVGWDCGWWLRRIGDGGSGIRLGEMGMVFVTWWVGKKGR